VRGYGRLRWSVQQGDRRSFRSGVHMRKVLRDYAKRKRQSCYYSHYPSPH
jgi:hypothetical protein